MGDKEVARDELGKQRPVWWDPKQQPWACPSRAWPQATLLRHRDKWVTLSDLKSLKFWGKEGVTEAFHRMILGFLWGLHTLVPPCLLLLVTEHIDSFGNSPWPLALLKENPEC